MERTYSSRFMPLVAVLCLSTPLSAADSGRYPFIVIKSRHADLSGNSDQVVGDFANEDQAAADALVRNQREPDLGIVYLVRVRPTKDIGKAIRDKGFKGYGKNLRLAYERAKRARAFLLNHTGQITRQSFKDTNALIEQYNKELDQLIVSSTKPGDVERVQPVLESEFPGSFKQENAEDGQYTVWVYQLVGGSWVKQDDRTFFTYDVDAGRNYINQVKRVQGWTATSNLPPEEPSSSVAGNSQLPSEGPVASSGPIEAELEPIRREYAAIKVEGDIYNRDFQAAQAEAERIIGELNAVDREGAAYNTLPDADRTQERLDSLNRRKAEAESRAQQVIRAKAALEQRRLALERRVSELKRAIDIYNNKPGIQARLEFSSLAE